MKATEAKFLDFIKKSPQFVIPTYQRTYSWTEIGRIIRVSTFDLLHAHQLPQQDVRELRKDTSKRPISGEHRSYVPDASVVPTLPR